jgi:hypothetical protein
VTPRKVLAAVVTKWRRERSVLIKGGVFGVRVAT